MDQRLIVLFQEGVLDPQFMQLLQLQDELSPNLVSEIASIYFHETEKLLRNLRELLVDREELDYRKIEFLLIKLMGSSACIGAKRIRDECVTFRNICKQNGTQAGCSLFTEIFSVMCLRSLEILEEQYSYLESKLSQVFQIERLLIVPSESGEPMQQQPPPPPNNPSA